MESARLTTHKTGGKEAKLVWEREPRPLTAGCSRRGAQYQLAFNTYRRLTHNMDKRFESIEDEEELDQLGHTCIICRDQIDLLGGCKKLPGCDHACHTHCLKAATSYLSAKIPTIVRDKLGRKKRKAMTKEEAKERKAARYASNKDYINKTQPNISPTIVRDKLGRKKRKAMTKEEAKERKAARYASNKDYINMIQRMKYRMKCKEIKYEKNRKIMQRKKGSIQAKKLNESEAVLH